MFMGFCALLLGASGLTASQLPASLITKHTISGRKEIVMGVALLLISLAWIYKNLFMLPSDEYGYLDYDFIHDKIVNKRK